MVRKIGLPQTFGSFPYDAMAEAMRSPGMDTREWISYGTVEASQQVDGETVESVEFDPDGMGPLVNVRLHPRNVSVRCRVASDVAGNGEGKYHPFVEGDEVIVALPGGELIGAVIFGRLNNTVDKFPSESVAGQDPTKNTFAFERRRAPFLQEHASSYMMRVASHGAFLLIADSGAITIRDGSKGVLQMGPDIFSFMEGGRTVDSPSTPSPTPSPTALLQLNLTGRRIQLQMDDAMLMMNSSKSDSQPGNFFLVSPGEVSVACGTNAPQETVLTLEAFVALLAPTLTALDALLPGTSVAFQGLLSAGGAPLLTPYASAIATGRPIAAAAAKADTTTSTPPGVQLAPGLGAVLFKTG